MKKVLITLLAVACFSAFAFAVNVNADPDEDWAERTANKAFITPTPMTKVLSATPYAAGDYYIPQGSNALGFDSLKAAVDSINVHGVTGAVNLLLDADTLREESFTFNAPLDAANNVTVKPAPGRNVVLIVTPGDSYGNGAQMIGFDKGYVTFDGSNNGTDTRNLIVTTETNDTRVPFGLNTSNADTVVLKNLIIKNLDNVTDNFKYGAVTNDVGGIDGFTVQNCQIGTPERPVWRDGVAVWGDWTNLYTQGIVIGNEIHTGARGISTYIFGDCVFNDNEVFLYPSATSYSYNYGVYLSWGTSAEVKNNIVHENIEATPTGSSVSKVGGIVTASHPEGAQFDVVNNMVIAGEVTETVPVYGFLHMSSSDAYNFNVYHNTFVVNDVACTEACHGIGNSSTGAVTMDLKNNIVINNHTGNTASSAISLVSGTTVLTSNNNVLVSDQNFATLGGTDYADLTAWQAADMDTNSVSTDVSFVSDDDLHLAMPSDEDLDLVFGKIAGIDTDIDGDARPNPITYAGADEGALFGPYVFFSEYIEGSGNNKALEIYNGTGETINLDNYRIGQSVNGGGWEYYHTFPTGETLASNDVWVLLNADTDSSLFDFLEADEVLSYPSAVHHNGDDARSVEYSPDGGTTWIILDVIGNPDVDPGSGWDVAGTSNATKNHTLVRKADVIYGNIDWNASAGTNYSNSEWVVFPENTMMYLGEHPSFTTTVDIDEDFSDDSDVANWRSENSGYTSAAHVDTVLRLSDGGWTFDGRRTVYARPNTFFKATARIKTGSFNTSTSQYLNFGIEGLGSEIYQVSCISEDDFTTFTVIGYAENDEGTLFIAGQGAGGADTVWVDEYTFTDNFVPGLTEIKTVAAAREVPVGEMVATKGVLTATTIGAPIFMQDGTAGISLYDWDFINDGIVKEGDEILVIGERAEYNGLQQLSYTNEKYIVLSENNVVEPTVITVPDLDSRDYQGMLVMIEDVDTVAGDFNWPAEGSSATIPLVDEASNEFDMRIDSDGNMDGATPPKYWPLDLIGIVGEFYSPQIMPRYMDDFITNQPPGPFSVLNPVDGDTITSLDDPAFVDQTIGTETVKTLLINWSKAADEADDTVTYEVMISPDGPENPLITEDTVVYIPIPEEKPWDMNGTYSLHVVATDLLGEVTRSDTGSVTFDFKAPPEVKNGQVVMVDGEAKYYAEFTLPIVQTDVSNYNLVDWDGGPAVAAPTAVDSVAPNAVLLTGDLPEDHWVSLAYSGIAAAGDTAATPLTTTDTTWSEQVIIPYSNVHPVDAAKTIESFESDVGLFKALTFSGSTSGIQTSSSFAVSDEAAYEGSKSGKMSILDDTAVDGGWYIRLLYDYPFSYTIKTNSTLMFLVKGTSANVQMRLSVKDSGYEQSPWHNITLSEDDWQVVSFDLLNDEAEGWITGNGIVEGETVLIEGIHMRCPEDADVTLYVDGFTERQRLDPVDVTLNVIMKKQVADGAFSLATDYVDVAGTFNDWSGTDMADMDGDTTYTVTLPLMPYSSHEFKFRINGSWSDDTAEFPYGGPARTLAVGTSESEHTYWYNDDTLEVAVDGIPDEFALHQNYPNPFNPTTTINFDLPEVADVKLVIYDISGRKIRTLVNNSSVAAGYKKIVWNGRDDYGNAVATGMYIYRLRAGEYVDVKKMTFLK